MWLVDASTIRTWAAPLLAALAATSPLRGEAICAPFCDALENPAAVGAAGGAVSGPVTFVPAVSSNGAQMAASGRVVYQQTALASPQGSLAFWFKKSSAHVSGGIAQIGTIGQAASFGLFYNTTDDLYLEVRNDAAEWAAIHAEDVLMTGDWVHLVASWDHRPEGTDLWLFLNGRFQGYSWLPGAFLADGTTLEIGATGYYGGGEGIWDELRFFDWNLADSEVYAEYVLSANRHRRAVSLKPASTGPVRVVDGGLRVEGRPFRVKGVGYQPVPVGVWPARSVLDDIYTDPAILARDMVLLRAMNANTIRTWSQVPDETLLDACYNGGVDPIYVLMGYWVPLHDGVDYADPTTRASIENDFRAYVQRFQHHPAVLAWGIGNEVNFNYTGTMSDWYTLAETLAAAAYAVEGADYHPTVLVNGGFWDLGDVDKSADDLSMPMLDIWGVNLYFGYEAHAHFDYYDRLTAKPLMFTEYGIDAWDNVAGAEHQAVQAAWVAEQYRQIRARTLGGTVMAYSDEWWKAETPAIHDFGGYATGVHMHPDGFSNEEWWGVVAVADGGSGPDVVTPRAVYGALMDLFADRTGDYDADGDTDLADHAVLTRCFGRSSAGCLAEFDFDADGDIDLADHEAWVACFGGPGKEATCAP